MKIMKLVLLFLLAKCIKWVGLNLLVDRFWPPGCMFGHMFDIPFADKLQIIP